MSDCILWTGGKTKAGYGCLKRGGKVLYAHRVAWEEVHGPIPPGYQLHHRCGQRACRNVGHMEMLTTGQHNRADRRKVSDEQVAEIRAATHLTKRELGAAFGLHPDYACAIRTGRARSEAVA